MLWCKQNSLLNLLPLNTQNAFYVVLSRTPPKRRSSTPQVQLLLDPIRSKIQFDYKVPYVIKIITTSFVNLLLVMNVFAHTGWSNTMSLIILSVYNLPSLLKIVKFSPYLMKEICEDLYLVKTTVFKHKNSWNLAFNRSKWPVTLHYLNFSWRMTWLGL